MYLPKLSAQAQKFGISMKIGFIGRRLSLTPLTALFFKDYGLFIWQCLPKIDSKLNCVHYCLVGGITGQQLRFQVSRDGVAESLMRGKFESS